MYKTYKETAPATFFNIFRKFPIRIQQDFQTCAT